MQQYLTGDEIISAVLGSHSVHLPTHAALVEVNKIVTSVEPVGSTL